ncbi:hypothetical protein LEMLEM_LOCUS25548 [Lemmus lemmus]
MKMASSTLKQTECIQQQQGFLPHNWAYTSHHLLQHYAVLSQHTRTTQVSFICT